MRFQKFLAVILCLVPALPLIILINIMLRPLFTPPVKFNTPPPLETYDTETELAEYAVFLEEELEACEKKLGLCDKNNVEKNSVEKISNP